MTSSGGPRNGTQFGPKPWQFDPYDNWSPEQLEDHFATLFASDRRVRTVPVTFRVPADLLERTKRAAEERHVPYQRLVKAIWEDALRAIERGSRTHP